MRNSQQRKTSQQTSTVEAEPIRAKQMYYAIQYIRDEMMREHGTFLTNYQRQASDAIIRAFAKGGNQEIDMLWSRRSGKTQCLVQTGLAISVFMIHIGRENFHWGLVNPGKTEQGIAVTRQRIKDVVASLSNWLAYLNVHSELDEGRKTPDFILHDDTFQTEAQIRAISGSPDADEKGAGFQLMFLEQVENLDETNMKTVIFPMADGKQMMLVKVLAGTPDLSIENNYFHEKTLGLKPPFFIDYIIAGRERPDYLDYVMGEKAALGEESEEFRTQYCCEWVQLRNRLVDRDFFINKVPEDYVPNDANVRVAGIDVAKDVDRTVATILERNGKDLHVLDWLMLEGTDYEDQAVLIDKFLKKWKIRLAMVDKGGPGNVLIDMMRKRTGLRIVPFEATAVSNDEMWTQYKREIDQGRLHYPKNPSKEQRKFWEHFQEEHIDAIREVQNNKIKVHAPDRRGAHDDFVMSGGMSVVCMLKSIRDAGAFMLEGARRNV